MHILLIDDDPATARSIELMLAREDMSCATARSGEDGIDLGKLYSYDLIILDLHLPDMSGHEVLRQLRRARIMTPVLILTGEDQLESKLTGFQQGADDVLVKPAHREELLARARALVRRSRGHAQSVIQTGALAVDLDHKCATIAGQPIALTGKEYRILELLALRRSTTVTKDMILNHLYGGLDEPESKIVDVFVCKLRKKLAQVGAEDAIQTVWGQGYCLREQVPQQRLVACRLKGGPP